MDRAPLAKLVTVPVMLLVISAPVAPVAVRDE